MKIADAKTQIEELFLRWESIGDGKDKYGNHFGLHFYLWIENNRPDLLTFRYSGDKYQPINGWVMTWQDRYRLY